MFYPIFRRKEGSHKRRFKQKFIEKPFTTPFRQHNMQLQKRIEEENHMIIKKLLEIDNKHSLLASHKANSGVQHFPNPHNKKKTFRSLNWVSRKNDYNRIKSENMRMISKIQNAKSALNNLSLKQHQKEQNKLKKLIKKNTSVSQMIENSRYKIAYSSY